MGNIESVMQENRVFPPSAEFVKQANVSGMDAYNALCAEAEKDYDGFWAKLARENITGTNPSPRCWTSATRRSYKWFDDGELNVSYNCLDGHLATQADKTAIIFEADDGNVTKSATAICTPASAARQWAEVAGHQQGRPRGRSTCRWGSKPWSRCRPAPASARSIRWCSAASPPRACTIASRTPARWRSSPPMGRCAAARRSR